jgi:hypothetical protein
MTNDIAGYKDAAKSSYLPLNTCGAPLLFPAFIFTTTGIKCDGGEKLFRRVFSMSKKSGNASGRWYGEVADLEGEMEGKIIKDRVNRVTSPGPVPVPPVSLRIINNPSAGHLIPNAKSRERRAKPANTGLRRKRPWQ